MMDFTYSDLIYHIESKTPIHFARWGDGEWNAIFGAKAGQEKNCDGTPYYEDLGLELYKVVAKPQRYAMGMQSLGYRQRKDDGEFLELIDPIDWCNADIIHHASAAGRMDELFEAIRERDVILIGNEFLDGILVKYPELIKVNITKINIDKSTAWLQRKYIAERIHASVVPGCLILYCAGMMTEVLLDEMYETYGDAISQVDVGSAFDPYAGEKTRRYHYKLKL